MTSSQVKFIVNTQCAVIRDGYYLMIVRGEGVKHAPGVLAFPGGKVEVEDGPGQVLESTVRREVLEETGIIVSSELEYVRSATFTMADGTPVVDVLFLGDYESGEPRITDPDEVADVLWIRADDIHTHEKTPPWLESSIDQVEVVRRRRTLHRPR